MGWWKSKHGRREAMIGDEVLDRLGNLWDDLTRIYEQEWKRKPTAAELAHALEVSLNVFMENSLQVRESAKIQLKTKREPTSSLPVAGDYFSIPVAPGIVTIGRVLTPAKGYGYMVFVYGFLGSEVPVLEVLERTSVALAPTFVIDEGWKSGRWKIVGNRKVTPEEFGIVQFQLQLNSKPALVKFAMDGSHAQMLVTQEEFDKKEPLTLHQAGSLELALRRGPFKDRLGPPAGSR